MLKKPFGRTGQELSLLGFGCMRLPLTNPDDLTSIDYDLATAMVRKAIDRGVNYVDTAWPYHGVNRVDPGQSEVFVAHALKDGYRDKVKLATKLPTWLTKSRADMNRCLDAQLKRLGVSYIDFYLAHNLNSIVWPQIREDGLGAFFDEALKDGRIKYAGFSFHDRPAVFEDILGSYDWSFAQIQYNYLDINYQAGQKGLNMALDKGLGVAVMEPLRGGFLINQLTPDMRKQMAAVRPEWSAADWAFRWLWSQPGLGVVLSGMSAMDQVDENLKIAENTQPLTDLENETLARIREVFIERLKVNCTGCGYCLPCPEGVNIPKNFSYFNDYWMTDVPGFQGRAKMYFHAQVSERESCNNCVHCRQCEEKCPQSLPISELMDEVAAVFN